MFTDDLVSILVAAGIPGPDIFVGTKASLPEGPGPFITIKETGGSPPEGTHNSVNFPAYIRPSAQIMTRGEDYVLTRVLAQKAYDALFPIRNRYINGSWWRQIVMKQEPFDLAQDEKGRLRIVFNIDVVKRGGTGLPLPLPPIIPLVIFEMVESLGGDRNSFLQPTDSDVYPIGSTFDKLVPGSWPVMLNSVQLYTGSYVFECNARVNTVGARVKAALFNLSSAPDTVMIGSELTFTADELIGERKRSSAFTVPASDTIIGAKLTVNSIVIGGAVWGCRILRM